MQRISSNYRKASLMASFKFKNFKKKMEENAPSLKRYITKLEKLRPKDLHKVAEQKNAAVWAEMDCLTCANCCKSMSPTFTPTDIKRIAAHLNISTKHFKEKWLHKDDEGDWVNKIQPCQFLNLEDNKCSIYEVRPKDCADFPHHRKKPMIEYAHVYKQNVSFCPATYKFIEKIKDHYTGV